MRRGEVKNALGVGCRSLPGQTIDQGQRDGCLGMVGQDHAPAEIGRRIDGILAVDGEVQCRLVGHIQGVAAAGRIVVPHEMLKLAGKA